MDTNTPSATRTAGQAAAHKAGNSAAPVPCWFMSNPFSAGMVYNQLNRADFEYVVGMDIGHGESLVALFCKSTGRVTLLNLNANYATKIPSYIRLSRDKATKVLIGTQAKKRPDFIQHFKVAPKYWKNKKNGYTHIDLMGNFIRALWEQALALSDDLRNAPKDKVMIVVGCPASPLWTDSKALRQYRDLVQAATQYNHVSILPESTAAIMSVIHSSDGLKKGHTLQLDRGLAVLDAGSSTLDFTYVILGKQLITRSLQLGGSDLDRQMLTLVLEQNGLSEDQIPQEQFADILVQLRMAKEQFYPDRESIQINIPIWGRNPDGSGSSEVDSGLTLKCIVNEPFMTAVLNRADIEPEGVVGGMKKSWLMMAEDFIRSCRDLIGLDSDGHLLCDHVLVTGGTSFVTELMDMIKNVYGKNLAVQSQDPSSSVAKGLAHAKRLDIQGHELVEAYKQEVLKISSNVYQGFLEDLCAYIADTSCDISREVCISLSQTPGKKKFRVMMETIHAASSQDPRLTGDLFDAKVQELFRKHFAIAYDALREKANEVSAGIYGANLQNSLPRIPPLSDKDMQAITSRLNLRDFVTKTLLDPISSSFVFSMVQSFVLYAALVLLDTGNFPAAIIVAFIAGLLGNKSVQQFLQLVIAKLPFVTFSNKKLQELAGKLDDQDYRQKTVGSISQDIVREIQTALKQKEKAEKKDGRRLADPRPLYKEFLTCLSTQAESILGKLLFLVYDEKPDAGEPDAQ